MLGMIWNYEFLSKEAFLQSKNEQTFADVFFDLTEKFLNSQNSVDYVNILQPHTVLWKLRNFFPAN